MELYYQASILLLFTMALADEEFIVYDFDLNSNTTEKSKDSKFNSTSVKCERDHLYDKMDIRDVLGKWRVVELYTHQSREGVNRYKSCPVITIWEQDEIPITTFGPSTENQPFYVQHINAKFRQEYRYLRLLWDEAGQTIEYSLYFRNISAGYWQVFNGQNGTLPALSRYQQFSGAVQVLKAVSDHLVLNFCQEGRDGQQPQLYSVLFSREPGQMGRWEIESVHSLLQTKKLSVASRRMVCGGAGKPLHSLLATIALCLLTYVISS